VGSSGVAGDAAADREQSQPYTFRFLSTCGVVGQGDHLHPRCQLDGEGRNREPDLILREAVQRQVRQAGVLGCADAILAAGAAPVPQLRSGWFTASAVGG